MKTRTNVISVVTRTEYALDRSPPSGGSGASISSIHEKAKQRHREVEYYGCENGISDGMRTTIHQGTPILYHYLEMDVLGSTEFVLERLGEDQKPKITVGRTNDQGTKSLISRQSERSPGPSLA